MHLLRDLPISSLIILPVRILSLALNFFLPCNVLYPYPLFWVPVFLYPMSHVPCPMSHALHVLCPVTREPRAFFGFGSTLEDNKS